MFWDPMYTLFVLAPTLVLGLGAQLMVKAAYARASRIRASRNLSGAAVAQEMLARSGVGQVAIEATHGFLADHYDPSSRTLRLSPDVYNAPSLAAAGIAAHEAGHALQHKEGYAPLALRSGIVPLVNVGQYVAQIALMVALFMVPGGMQSTMFQVAVLGYALLVAFALITLPVEFNASRRAMAALTSQGLITAEEAPIVRSVLRAAALTYVAAAVSAILHLLYVLMLARRSDD